MTFPWALPDWLPWWAVLLMLVPALVYLLLFLLMPFSVFGVKDRLELIETQLADIQEEIRQLLQRPADPEPPQPEQPRAEPRPAMPPRSGASSWQPDPPEDPVVTRPAMPRRTDERPNRAEPRFDWPR